MDWENFHLIKGKDINIIYHYPTSTMTVVNDMTYNVAVCLKKNIATIEIANKYGLNERDVLAFTSSMHEKYLSRQSANRENVNDKIIGRITLHVSNDCNLRCKYCYADGGGYNQERLLMNKETAHNFVEFCTSYYEKVHTIVFFGGEPFLNVDIMEYICNEFKEYYALKKSSFIPQFAAITNGTIINRKVIRFIKENISFMTVSIDGPQEINDANRVFKNGKGSYEKIHRFIHAVQKETNVDLRFEATYTQSHINSQYSGKDIKQFMAEEFKIKGFVELDDNMDVNYMLDYWNKLDYEELVKSNFSNMPIGFRDILSTLVNKEDREMCSMMKDIFAIGADGSIYPCHMLNGIMKKTLGNINGEHFFNTDFLHDNYNKIINLPQNSTCYRCWGKYMCGGCTSKFYYNQLKKDFDTVPNSALCNINLRHLEQVLLMIATIRQDANMWGVLTKKLNEKKTANL